MMEIEDTCSELSVSLMVQWFSFGGK